MIVSSLWEVPRIFGKGYQDLSMPRLELADPSLLEILEFVKHMLRTWKFRVMKHKQ